MMKRNMNNLAYRLQGFRLRSAFLRAAIAVSLVVLGALAAQPSKAGVYTYSGVGTSRNINCGILLLDSTKQTLTPGQDIIAPYVFYILSQRGDVLPAGWNVVNPGAPSNITTDIITRFNSTAQYTLGQQLTSNMAAYWEVSLPDAAAAYTLGQNTLSQYDVLLIHTHNLIGLNRAEREILRQYVDQGGTLWIEDSGNAFTIDTTDNLPAGLFADVQFHDVGSQGFAFIGDGNHHNPILTQPYALTTTEINNLGDKDVGQFYMTSMNGSNISPDPYLLTTAVGNTAAVDVNGNYMPYISTGAYGSGHIIIDNADVADAISNPVDPNANTPAETGICPPNIQASTPNDLKFLVNMIAWASNTAATDQANPRRTGAQPDALVGSGSLSKSWVYPDTKYNVTVPSTYYPNAPVQIAKAFGSAIVGNIVYTTASINNAANTGSPVPTLQSFDLLPSEDLNQDNNPDDGVPTLADSYTGLGYTADYSSGTSYDELWSVQPNPGTAQLSPPMVAALPTGFFGSKGYYDSVGVEDDSGNVYVYDASCNPTTPIVSVPAVIAPPSGQIPAMSTFSSQGVPVPAPVYYHGWIIAAEPLDSNNRPRVLVDYLPQDPTASNPTLVFLDGAAVGPTQDKTPIISPPAIGFIPSSDTQYGGSDLVCYVATRQAVYPLFLGARDEKFQGSPPNVLDKVTVMNGLMPGILNVMGAPEDAFLQAGVKSFTYLHDTPDFNTTFPDFQPAVPQSSTMSPPYTILISGSPVPPIFGDYDIITDPATATPVSISRHIIQAQPANLAPTAFAPTLNITNVGLLGVQGIALGPDNALYLTVNEQGTTGNTGYIEKVVEQNPVITGTGTLIKWRFALTNTDATATGDNINYAMAGFQFVGAPVVDNNNVYALIYNSGTGKSRVLCFNLNPILKITVPNPINPPGYTITQTNEIGSLATMNQIPQWETPDPTNGGVVINDFSAQTTVSNTLAIAPNIEVPDPLTVQNTGDNSTDFIGINTSGSGQPLLNWYAEFPIIPIGGPVPPALNGLPAPIRRIGTQIYFARGYDANGKTEVDHVTVGGSTSAIDRQLTLSTTNPLYGAEGGLDAGNVTTGMQGSGSSVILMGSIAKIPSGTGTTVSNGGIEAIGNQLTMVADNDRLIEMDSSGQASWVLDSTVQPIIAGADPALLDFDSIPAGTTFSSTSIPLSRPSSLIEISANDILFADSGNSRCVQVDRQGHVLWEMTSFTDPVGLLTPGAPLTLSHPSSVTVWSENFVDTSSGPTGDLPIYAPNSTRADGIVYHYLISDSGNSRVLLVDDVFVNGKPIPTETHVLRWVSHTSDNQNRQYRYVFADRYFGVEPAISGSPGLKTFILASVANKQIAPLIDGTASSPSTPQMDSPLKDGAGSSVVFLEFDPVLSYDSANGFKAAVPSSGSIFATLPPTGYTSGLPVYLINSLTFTQTFPASASITYTLPLRNLRQISSYTPIGSVVPNIMIADDDGVFDGQATIYSVNYPNATKTYNLELNTTPGAATPNNFSFTAVDYANSNACKLGGGIVTNPQQFVPVCVQRLHNGDYLITNGAAQGDTLQAQLTSNNTGKTVATFTGNVFAISPTNNKDIDGSVPVYGRYLPSSLYTGVTVTTGPTNTGALSQPSSAVQEQ